MKNPRKSCWQQYWPHLATFWVGVESRQRLIEKLLRFYTYIPVKMNGFGGMWGCCKEQYKEEEEVQSSAEALHGYGLKLWKEHALLLSQMTSLFIAHPSYYNSKILQPLLCCFFFKKGMSKFEISIVFSLPLTYLHTFLCYHVFIIIHDPSYCTFPHRPSCVPSAYQGLGSSLASSPTSSLEA